MLASLSSFAFVLDSLVALIALALSVSTLSSSDRKDAVIVLRFLISSDFFSFKLLYLLILASLSSFAFVLDSLVALIALALSVSTLSSSDRKDAVIVLRFLISSDFFSFKLLYLLMLASLSSFVFELA